MITVHGVRVSSHPRSKPLFATPVLPRIQEIIDQPRIGTLDELYLVPEDYAQLLHELKLSPFDVAAGVSIG